MVRQVTVFRAWLIVVVLGAAASCQDRILHESKSAYNEIVVSEDSQGLRTLRFEKGGARQSVVKLGDPDHLELPYTRVMPVALAFVERPQRVLIIGLGGGTIPTFLRKHFPETEIDVVDIDPVVVKVAHEYFGFREDPLLHAHVADGRKFVEDCQTPYDLIFLDAFDRDSIPYHLATREFLKAVRRALRPGGVVVSNVWRRYVNPLYDSMLLTYIDVFPDVYVVDAPSAGNQIVMALPHRWEITRDAFRLRASRVSRDRRFPFDMGDLARPGFRYSHQLDLNGQVLTDADARRKAG